MNQPAKRPHPQGSERTCCAARALQTSSSGRRAAGECSLRLPALLGQGGPGVVLRAKGCCLHGHAQASALYEQARRARLLSLAKEESWRTAWPARSPDGRLRLDRLASTTIIGGADGESRLAG
jgi:hypothetical protein